MAIRNISPNHAAVRLFLGHGGGPRRWQLHLTGGPTHTDGRRHVKLMHKLQALNEMRASADSTVPPHSRSD